MLFKNMKRTIKDTESFIKESNKIHGDLFDYSLVKYINSKTKVKILCQSHGEFEVSPDNHIRRESGCPYCSKNKLNNNLFIEKAKKIHGDIYNYSKLKYLKHREKVIIICPKHGEFEQTPDSHLQGSGCIYCFKKIKTSIEGFKTKSTEKHGNKYDYSMVNKIKNNTSKVTIICHNHGKFQQQVKHHINGSGCPKCSESKGELEIMSFLNENNITYEFQKKFIDCLNKKTNKHLKFDFYLPKYSICIEYDGIQHSMPVKFFGGIKKFKELQKRDEIKNDFCIKNNIKLIRIKYDELVSERLKILL